MTFRRGAGPLISVLIPSRGRAAGLAKAVASLYATALDRDLIETLIKVDVDDLESCATAHLLAKSGNIRVLQYGRGQGYADLHLFINDLAALSRGDWLFLFNDDAEIRTLEWEQVIRTLNVDHQHDCPEMCMLYASTDATKTDTSFPILRREVYEVIGHMAGYPYVDEWLRAVMFFCSSAFRVPIEIAHDPIGAEAAGDPTTISTINAHQWIAGRQAITDRVRGMWEDVGKVLDYIDGRRR